MLTLFHALYRRYPKKHWCRKRWMNTSLTWPNDVVHLFVHQLMSFFSPICVWPDVCVVHLCVFVQLYLFIHQCLCLWFMFIQMCMFFHLFEVDEQSDPKTLFHFLQLYTYGSFQYCTAFWQFEYLEKGITFGALILTLGSTWQKFKCF